MKYFRSLAFLIASAAILLSSPLLRADSSWLSDFKQAQQQAKTGNRLMLIDFTGSDWCGWCIKLQREVFSKPEFKDYAMKNLVLMEADFPRGKHLKSEVQEQNQSLAQEYGIQGFPTIVVLDAAGKKVGELGYMEGGPKAFIAELEKLRKG